MKGHMQDGKFHPHTDYKKGVRKSRDQKAKTQGVNIERKARYKKTRRVSEDQGFNVDFAIDEGIASQFKDDDITLKNPKVQRQMSRIHLALDDLRKIINTERVMDARDRGQKSL